MGKWVAVAALLVGCGPASLEIIDPIEGAQVNANPLVLTLVGDNVHFGDVYMSYDGIGIRGQISTSYIGECDDCDFVVTLYDQSIPDGLHEVTVMLERDLSEVARTSISLEFVR